MLNKSDRHHPRTRLASPGTNCEGSEYLQRPTHRFNSSGELRFTKKNTPAFDLSRKLKSSERQLETRSGIQESIDTMRCAILNCKKFFFSTSASHTHPVLGHGRSSTSDARFVHFTIVRREAGRRSSLQVTANICSTVLFSEIRRCGLGVSRTSWLEPYHIDYRELGWYPGSALASAAVHRVTSSTSERIARQTEYNLEGGGDTGYTWTSSRRAA